LICHAAGSARGWGDAAGEAIMRRFTAFAIAFALAGCGQTASTADAQGGASNNAQAAYQERCLAELVAQNPGAREWGPGQCQQQWETIVAAGPIADAILAAAPSSGAADTTTVRSRLTGVRWDARPEGALIASGVLADVVSVQIDRAGPSLNFYWSEVGALIPFDAVEALRVRGAEATMVGCSQLGTGEFNRVYRVAAPERAPFMLAIYDRTAPTANANSSYSVSMNLAGQMQTLAQLRRDGSEWSERCAY
jgi:hypothetical protein